MLETRVALDDVPPGHGTGVAAPASQKKPAMQSMHAVWPLWSWYSPGTQLTHSDWPDWSVMLPGTHFVGAVEPVAQADPAGHTVQSLASLSLGRFEKRPAGHGNSADAPDGQNFPALQLRHDVAPVWS